MLDAEGAALGEADSLEAAAKLTRSERYKDVMGRVRAALEGGAEEGNNEVAWTGPSEESPTYRCRHQVGARGCCHPTAHIFRVSSDAVPYPERREVHRMPRGKKPCAHDGKHMSPYRRDPPVHP